MKNTILPVSLLFCMVSLFFGCENPEENELPKISNLKVDGKEVILNTVASREKDVVISFSVSDDDKVKSVTVSETGKTKKVFTNPSVNQETAQISFPYTVTQATTLEITITDSDNKSITSNLLITVVHNNAPVITNLKVNGTPLIENGFSGESQLLTLSFSASDDDGLHSVIVAENGSLLYTKQLNDSLTGEVTFPYQLTKSVILTITVTDNQEKSVTTYLTFVLIKNENEAPTISNLKVDGAAVTNETPKLLAGEKLISFTAMDDNELQSVSVSESGGSSPIFYRNGISKPNADISFIYNLAKTTDLIIIVTDNDDKTMTTYLKINFDPGVNSFSAILLGAPSNPVNGSFFATSTGTVFNLVDAKTNASQVDIIYFYGATNQATLAAPSNTDAQTVISQINTWTTKNVTTFKKASSSTDFAGIVSASAVEAAYNAATGAFDTKANALVPNDIITFKTAAGKYGIAKVVSVAVGVAGSITINVKVGK